MSMLYIKYLPIMPIKWKQIKSFFGLILLGTEPYSNLKKANFSDIQGLDSYYTTNIFPLVRQIDNDRIETAGSMRGRFFLSVLAFIILILLCVLWREASFKQILALNVLLVIIWPFIAVVWIAWPVRKFQASIKDLVFPPIFGFFGEDFEYHRESPHKIPVLSRSQVLPLHSKSIIDGSLHGTLDGTFLEVIKARLFFRTITGNRRLIRSYFEVFAGYFVRFRLQRTLPGPVIIRQDVGLLDNLFRDTFSSYRNIPLENSIHEDEFQIYSNEQVAAKEILTTELLDQLMIIRDQYDSSLMHFSFHENYFLLMIRQDQGILDPPSIYFETNFETEIRAIHKEISLYYRIIDILNRNEYIASDRKETTLSA